MARAIGDSKMVRGKAVYIKHDNRNDNKTFRQKRVKASKGLKSYIKLLKLSHETKIVSFN
jgi:hypothetical protein